jgi:hypothetical protein
MKSFCNRKIGGAGGRIKVSAVQRICPLRRYRGGFGKERWWWCAAVKVPGFRLRTSAVSAISEYRAKLKLARS